VIRTLLSHQWKSFWRSRNSGKSLAMQIVIGFFTLYLLVSALGIGFFLKKIIIQLFPGQEPTGVFCGFILYYFAFDILMRFQFQDLPTLTVQPYLTQNIRRNQLIKFLNIRSLFTILNIFPVLLFVPFTIIAILPRYGLLPTISFILAILLLTIVNHFLILFVKRKSIINSWWYVGFFAVIALFMAADYFKVLPISRFSTFLFTKVLSIPWLVLIPAVLAWISYYNNYRFLYRHLYLEDIEAKAGKRKEGTQYSFLDRFGIMGELIGLDIKLMLRNKRPRSILMLSVIFLFYGFIFYKPQYLQKDQWGFMLIGGIFLTGLFISNYGQFLFSWQSAHFDGLMAGHLNVKTYIKSKFLLFNVVSTISLLLAAFYGLMNWKIIVMQTAAYFYNIGIHTVVAVYFATRSYKGLDLTKGSSFNFQGIGAAQWIYSLFVFIIPFVIYLPVALIFNAWTGIAALGITGLISFLLQDWWIDILSKEFNKRKHLILEGFREK
jgi:hypothetical protein